MNDHVSRLYKEYLVDKWPFHKLSVINHNRQGWAVSIGNTYEESRISLQEFIDRLSTDEIVIYGGRCYSPEHLPR